MTLSRILVYLACHFAPFYADTLSLSTILLHGYGEVPSEQFACITTFTTPVHSQTLTTPKLKELLISKSRCKQLLLAATTTPNFVVFRCIVPKIWHENGPHTSV